MEEDDLTSLECFAEKELFHSIEMKDWMRKEGFNALEELNKKLNKKLNKNND